MADPIDPRLYVSSLPPRGQPYTAAPQHSAGHPYYLAAASHQPPPHPSPPAPLGAALDPALEQTSPTQPESPTAADDGDGDDHDDHDHEGTHETPGSAKSPGDSKRPRACDSCRGLKVRCDQERPDVSCKRCAKAGRACITTPPTRKRQKKADSRVAELERKIDALTATLHAQNPATPGQHDAGTAASSAAEAAFRLGALAHDWRTSPAAGYAAAPPGYGPAQNFQPSPAAKRRKLDGGSHALSHTLSHTAAPARTPAAAAAAAACSPRQTISEDMDAIHRDLAEHPEMKRSPKTRIHADYSYINGLIDSLMSPDVAERVFIRYNQQICPHFPAVPFAPGTTAAELREKKPLLFLSLLAGSSHGSSEQLVPQHVQRELTKLLKDQLADIIWRNGEKSLEIVQALQIAVLWYRPPLHFEQHNFYMMVNCAAVMALDLGLGRKTTPDVMKLSIGPFRRYHPNSSSIEARRTFLVCYYLCMSITMVLRRPILLRWTKYMEESIKILETSPDALPSDKLLCRQVKMARIGEDISVQFCMDDPSIEVAISEPKVIYAMKIFENELQQLREDNAAMGEVDPTLRLAEHVTNLYLHEIALHKDQGGTDLHPPYTEESVTPGGKGNVSIGPAHIGALGECLTATHGILDTMLSIPLDVLLALPVIFCVRAIYAIVCLMKMWVSVTSSNEVGSVIKTEHLQIEAYTEQLVSMFNAIVSRDAQSPHGKFYFVAKRLQERFIQIKQGTTKEQSEPEFRSPKQSDEATRQPAHHSSTNQTPLHLLSEVAMGSSNNASSHQQAQSHARSQQQAQAALQAAHHAQQSMHSNWYSGMPAQQMDMNGMPQANFDFNFDFTQFDLGTGSDADLSALFIPDAVMWSYPTTDPNLQGYNGFQSGL